MSSRLPQCSKQTIRLSLSSTIRVSQHSWRQVHSRSTSRLRAPPPRCRCHRKASLKKQIRLRRRTAMRGTNAAVTTGTAAFDPDSTQEPLSPSPRNRLHPAAPPRPPDATSGVDGAPALSVRTHADQSTSPAEQGSAFDHGATAAWLARVMNGPGWAPATGSPPDSARSGGDAPATSERELMKLRTHMTVTLTMAIQRLTALPVLDTDDVAAHLATYTLPAAAANAEAAVSASAAAARQRPQESRATTRSSSQSSSPRAALSRRIWPEPATSSAGPTVAQPQQAAQADSPIAPAATATTAQGSSHAPGFADNGAVRAAGPEQGGELEATGAAAAGASAAVRQAARVAYMGDEHARMNAQSIERSTFDAVLTVRSGSVRAAVCCMHILTARTHAHVHSGASYLYRSVLEIAVRWTRIGS